MPNNPQQPNQEREPRQAQPGRNPERREGQDVEREAEWSAIVNASAKTKNARNKPARHMRTIERSSESCSAFVWRQVSRSLNNAMISRTLSMRDRARSPGRRSDAS